MTDSEWVSVDDAMALSKRSRATIYAWAKAQTIRSRRGDTGTLVIHGRDVLEAEASVKRGRPTGSARPPMR